MKEGQTIKELPGIDLTALQAAKIQTAANELREIETIHAMRQQRLSDIIDLLNDQHDVAITSPFNLNELRLTWQDGQSD